MNLSLLKRWQRWALFFLLGMALLWVISWAAVPRLVQWQVEKQGARMLGRVVTLEQVAFRPWSMALILRGLRIGKAGSADTAADPQLTVDEIEVNAALQSLVLLAPVTDAVLVHHPQLHLTHLGEGRFDIDDVMSRFSGGGSQGSGIPRLSLFNIQIAGGAVEFRDEPKLVTHTLSEVQLDIPFLSNIGGRRDVATRPRLAFKLNGAAFDTDAETAPFAKDRHTQARFQIKAFDVAPYLPYWPAAWPARLADGHLALDITLNFRQQAAPEVLVSGHVALTSLKLNEKAGTTAELPLVQLGGLDIKVDAWHPLESIFKLDSLSLEKPVVYLRRDRAGELNWARLQRFFAPGDRAGQGSAPAKSGASLTLNRLRISGGQVHWQDAATSLPADVSLNDLDFQSDNLSWPASQVATLQGKAGLQGASLSWDGTTDLKSAQVRLQWRDLSLKIAAPYWAELFRPELSGQSVADLNLDWRAAAGTEPASLVVKAPQIRVTGVSLGLPAKPEAALAELTIDQAEVDVFKHQARVGRVALTRPMLQLSRREQGRWMFEDWSKGGDGQTSATPSASVPNPWLLDLRQLQINGGAIHLDDLSVEGAAKLDVLDVLDVNLSTGPWQPFALRPQMTPVKLDLRTGTQRREAGSMGFEGAFSLPSIASSAQATPLQIKGRLQLTRLPVHKLSAYLADRLNFDLKRADLSYVGGLDLALPDAGMGLGLQGNLSVENLRAINKPDGEDLLDIKSLNLRGLDLGFQSGALEHLKISETAFNDFFARVAIDASGHLNLQHLLKPPAAKGATPPAAASAAAVTPLVELGPIAVVNGRVLFSDHYIRPNYSADVTELVGSLGAFSNKSTDANPAPLADLNMRGRVAGSASLEVNGRINPLTRPLALDVRGKVRDLELPQLSPYSNKYAGYGIERGKLSAEVNYRIDADGQLRASHQIILNQLRFGERSDSVDAPNLPVKLAVALLADGNGVIDIHLPVSGSVNDPDFRVGAIVWKMVLNLIGKAIIAPFSLISGAFSGDDQLQQIVFQPGRADLDDSTRQKLDAVAKRLLDKPSLRLTIAGEADLATEQEALRRSKLHDLVAAEKRRRLSRDGQDALAVIEVSSDEYPALLKSAYRRSTVPKPRNLLGLVKDLPQADMEALLLAALSVDASDMRELAQARAQKVREALAVLNVPAGQLFLGAPVVADAARKSPFVPQAALIVSTE